MKALGFLGFRKAPTVSASFCALVEGQTVAKMALAASSLLL